MRNYFREPRQATGSGGASDDVTFGPVEPGRVYTIDELAIEDKTTTVTTEARVLISGHGYDHPVLEQATPAAGTLYWLEGRTLHLFEGETLVARFVGATSGDVLQMYLAGYWEET